MYTSSITIDQVIDALADFIQPFAPNNEIVRAQANRVAMPNNPCIILTEMRQTDLSVPYVNYYPDLNSGNITGRKQIDVQIDFYGVDAGQICDVVKTAFRSHWGFDNFPENIKPLYTSDGLQSPLTTGEQQYESRWTLTAYMQYNPSVSVPQDFADVLTTTIMQADGFNQLT